MAQTFGRQASFFQYAIILMQADKKQPPTMHGLFKLQVSRLAAVFSFSFINSTLGLQTSTTTPSSQTFCFLDFLLVMVWFGLETESG